MRHEAKLSTWFSPGGMHLDELPGQGQTIKNVVVDITPLPSRGELGISNLFRSFGQGGTLFFLTFEAVSGLVSKSPGVSGFLKEVRGNHQ